MTLKPRERAILWTTVVVMVLSALWVVGIQPIYASYSETQELLEKEEKKYLENQEILRGARKIEQEFERIKAAIPRDATDERSAQDAFSEDVNQLATTILGSRPGLGIVDVKPMKEVQGFSFLTFPISATGTLDSIARLLKAFDQRGYLIRRVSIRQRDIDSPNLNLELELARIVQIEEEKSEGRRSRWGFGRGIQR